MKWNKWRSIGLSLVLVVGAGGGYWWWNGHKTEKPLQAAFQTTVVRKGNVEASISGTGNIEAASRQKLSTSSSGTIASVKVKQGDKVKKGQVLATFKPDGNSSTETQIKSKELDLQRQQIDLANLQTQYKEAPDDDTRAKLAISIRKQQLDMQSTEEAIASLKEEGDGLDPITAPIDGTLATFNIQEGDVIGGQGASSASLGEVVDYDRLQMVVGVDELDIPKVKLNQQATVLVEALPDQTFTGKVTSIAEEGTPSNGVSTFDVTVTLEKADNLKAGMSAEARIVTARKTGVLYLPIEAVQSFGNQYFVMVPSASGGSAGTGQGDQAAQHSQGVQGQSGQRQQSVQSQAGSLGRQSRQASALAQSGVRRVQVRVGIHNEDVIEIVSGLQEGDTVVLPAATASGSTQNNRGGSVGVPGIGVGVPGGFGGGGNFVRGGGNGGNNRMTHVIQGGNG